MGYAGGSSWPWRAVGVGIVQNFQLGGRWMFGTWRWVHDVRWCGCEVEVVTKFLCTIFVHLVHAMYFTMLWYADGQGFTSIASSVGLLNIRSTTFGVDHLWCMMSFYSTTTIISLAWTPPRTVAATAPPLFDEDLFSVVVVLPTPLMSFMQEAEERGG